MPIFTDKNKSSLVYAFLGDGVWGVTSLITNETEELKPSDFKKKYPVMLSDDEANALAAKLHGSEEEQEPDPKNPDPKKPDPKEEGEGKG